MPLFEYRCEKCGETFEFLARKADETPDRCPKCGSRRLSRQFSAFSARMGSGSSDSSGSSCATGTCPTGTCPLS